MKRLYSLLWLCNINLLVIPLVAELFNGNFPTLSSNSNSTFVPKFVCVMAQIGVMQKLSNGMKTIRTTHLTRRTFFIVIAVCVCIVYIGPFFYRRYISTYDGSRQVQNCLEKYDFHLVPLQFNPFFRVLSL